MNNVMHLCVQKISNDFLTIIVTNYCHTFVREAHVPTEKEDEDFETEHVKLQQYMYLCSSEGYENNSIDI